MYDKTHYNKKKKTVSKIHKNSEETKYVKWQLVIKLFKNKCMMY